jgi:SAM-dependent methyltransferase
MAMPDLERIYDRAFFEEWGTRNARFLSAADKVTEILCAQLKPARIVDVGCGCGVYVDAFRRRGVEVVAIDGVECPPDLGFPVDLVKRDFTRPFENEWGRFDFTLSLEVAEHIPERFADAYLDNLVKLSDVLVLSAAPPNQGGTHHVNEQPKRYWVAKLADRGFRYDRKSTGVFLEACKNDPPAYGWIYQQISIYERAKGPIARDRLPFGHDRRDA